MSKSKFTQIAIITVLFLSLTVSLVEAQYTTSKTTPVTISGDGTFIATEPDIGVSYLIEGTPGATGSVTAAIYSGNPQPNAVIPDGVSLTHFVVVTFDMDLNQFTSASIVISYTDADVANLQAPYAIYKYVPNTDSFVELASNVNTDAKTITITVTSIDDPVFAVGAAAVAGGFPASSWAILIGLIVAIVVVAVVAVLYLRRSGAISKIEI